MKRLGIFVFYDAAGYVGSYVEYLLSDVIKNADELMIVCNGILSEEGRAKLARFSDRIYVRENTGFDATAWKTALSEYLGWDKVGEYDEILFFNDTFYGPLYPLKKVFSAMDARGNLDFWAITRHYPANDTTDCHKSGVFPEHLQSYFFAVRRRMLVSDAFKAFWTGLPKLKTFKQAVGYFESSFTQYFSERGFLWDSYVKMDCFKSPELDNFCVNYYLPYTLVTDFDMPFIRRKCLAQSEINGVLGPEREARQLLHHIVDDTSYDISLIWQDLLRRFDISELYSRLHLDYVLPTGGVVNKPLRQPRVALLMHIFYADQMAYCVKYARSMPSYADIYLITSCEDNAALLRAAFDGVDCGKIEIRLVENRGRDMAALYIGCADILSGGAYDYICFVHDKKSPQAGYMLGRSFRDILFENLLASPEYVENVIGIMDREPLLGYLGVPFMYGGNYWQSVSDAWTCPQNIVNTQKLLGRCGIERKLSADKPPILYGNAFWCRPEALLPLSQLKLSYEDFDPEPLANDGTFSHALERAVTYAAQSQGYYSGVLFTDEYASTYLPAMALAFRREHAAPLWSVLHSRAFCFGKSVLRHFPSLFNAFKKMWLRRH